MRALQQKSTHHNSEDLNFVQNQNNRVLSAEKYQRNDNPRIVPSPKNSRASDFNGYNPPFSGQRNPGRTLRNSRSAYFNIASPKGEKKIEILNKQHRTLDQVQVTREFNLENKFSKSELMLKEGRLASDPHFSNSFRLKKGNSSLDNTGISDVFNFIQILE